MRFQRTVKELLEDRAKQTPEFIFGFHEGHEISFAALDTSVNRLANGLANLGVGKGQHVAVMLKNHLDHIITFLALSKLGVVWIPVNIYLRGPSLKFIINQSAPTALISEMAFWNMLKPILRARALNLLIIRNLCRSNKERKIFDFHDIWNNNLSPLPNITSLDDLRCISFTSGTTGPPKGVLLTEQMLRGCTTGAAMASEVTAGDKFLLWEPLYHTSGCQMCILALQEKITLVIVARFSASRFWDLIKKHHITKIHYLGGILDILLKQPESDDDRNHNVTIAFGGGCSQNSWSAFEKRFKIAIREVYGLTEASGFSTLNSSGKPGSIGKPLPYFEVQIVDYQGKFLPAYQVGEIILKEKERGFVTRGYLNNPKGTDAALKDGWLHTGDLGSYDSEGNFYYVGRKSDSIRRRGENISAWEVERILNDHPNIHESAVIGVPTDLGEQELKAFIVSSPCVILDPLDIVKWCEKRMPYYQIPRYIKFCKSFEKTSTERIRKKDLSRSIKDCWDLETSEYKIQRNH